MAINVVIGDTERDALIRIAYAEARLITSVDAGLRYGSIVDSIINRVAANNSAWGSTITEVINDRGQYEPVAIVGGTWENLAIPPQEVIDVVNQHIDMRLNGGASTVGTATHYLNPTVSYALPAFSQWGGSMVNTVTVGPSIFDDAGFLRDNYNTHYFGNTANTPGEYPEDYLLIDANGAQPAPIFDVPPYNGNIGGSPTTSIRPLIRPENQCFGAGTPIDMWPVGLALKPNADGVYDQAAVRAGIWTKPIEDVTDTDVVISFDKQGNLVPGNVTRTMTNNAKIILDFHGTFVTPGHVYWCAGGKYEGKYAPLIDILRDDGVIQHQDGTLIRASTGCEVGTPDDEEFHVFKLYKDEQGNERVRDKTKLRYGTRWMMENGQHCTMRDYMEGIGVEILQDGPQRGYARWKETGMTTLFAWVLSDTLPQPADFVLARSATSLEDIYKAGQWEFMQPTMPPPMVMDGGPVQPLSERKLEMMPRNQPMAFSSAAPSSELLPDSNPQMNRRQRKAAEAKARRAQKNKRPKGATLH